MKKTLCIVAASAVLASGADAAETKSGWISARCTPFAADGWAAGHMSMSDCVEYNSWTYDNRRRVISRSARLKPWSDCVKARTPKPWKVSRAEYSSARSAAKTACSYRYPSR